MENSDLLLDLSGEPGKGQFWALDGTLQLTGSRGYDSVENEVLEFDWSHGSQLMEVQSFVESQISADPIFSLHQGCWPRLLG